MRTIALALGLACVLVVISPVVALAVNIPDAHLEQAVRDALSYPTGAITQTQMDLLTSLDARYAGIDSLVGLQYATHLTDLNLGANNISDVTQLQDLPLTSLVLDQNPISDVSALDGITTLTNLDLSYDSIDDVGPLSTLTSLTTLSLDGNQISDITPLGTLTNLTQLTLSDNDISSIAAVGALTNLTAFEADGNSLTSIAPVQNLTNLTYLELSDNSITSIAPVQNLTNLTDLEVNSNHITNIAPVQNLTHLTDLYLSHNDIADIHAVSQLSDLLNLQFIYNDIVDITPVGTLVNLETLTLDHNDITQITPVQNLTHLTYLGLDSNTITDIGPVQNLTNLEQLWLGNNLIGDVTPLQNLTHLEILDVNTNAIYDITPLQSLTNNTDLLLDVSQNWLDLSEGSDSMLTIAGLVDDGAGVTDVPQGVVTGHVHSAFGGAVPGASVAVASGPNGTSLPGGSYSLTVMPGGWQVITFSAPYFYSHSWAVLIGAGTTYVLDAQLTPKPIQIDQSMQYAPHSSSCSYTRKKGVAKFTLSVVLTDARGAVTGKTVWLQKSTNGTKWSNVYKLTTNSSGKVSKTLSVKKKGTTYYRWSSAATVYDNAGVTPKQKVVVK